MALAATTGNVVPILELTRRSVPYGTYVREGDHIRGLIYAPFVEFLKHELQITGQVRVELTAEDIAAELEKITSLLRRCIRGSVTRKLRRLALVVIWCW